MYITNINSHVISTGKMIPLNEYKGPILKLTKKDKEKIAELMKRKSEFEIELSGIQDRLERNQKMVTKEWQRLSFAEHRIRSFISILEKRIKQIKIDRLNKQKAKL